MTDCIYLGFLETLQNILSAIFEDILSPIISGVLNWAWKEVSDLLWKQLSELLLDAYINLLKMVNVLCYIFTIFSGQSTIRYAVKEGGPLKSATLPDYLFHLSSISRVFAVLTLSGTLLAFAFSAFAAAKSIADITTDEERAQPVSAVLTNALKASLTFLLIPVLCTCILQLSGAIMQSVNTNFIDARGSSADSSRRGGMENAVFLITIADAGKKGKDAIQYFSENDTKFQDHTVVKEKLNIEKIDYMTGFLGCGLLILLLGGAAISCVRRLFDLLVMYLVSPYFAATIALDGGAKFREWREKFIKKFFVCFGSIFSMELFLLTAPVITTKGGIVFSDDASRNGIIKFFFLLGSTWAIFRGSSLLGDVLNPGGANNEGNALLTGMISRGIGGLRQAADSRKRKK